MVGNWYILKSGNDGNGVSDSEDNINFSGGNLS